jgi:2-oxoglutarate/2-oxoacid ferredoxin oxidoreductase subunit beta
MNSSPNGIPERTLNAMDFVFSLQPTFVARGFSGNVQQMKEILKAAINHNGFAFVDMLQACPTWNKFATHDYLLENCYDITEKKSYDPTNFVKARKTAIDTSKKISTGILYQDTVTPSFIDNLVPRQGVKTTPVQEVKRTSIAEYMKEFV